MLTKRISAYLGASGLAAAGFMAVAAAPAVSASTAITPSITGATISTTNASGYEASKRDFRYIGALLRVPDWWSNTFYPQRYIQLSNGSLNQYGGTTGDQYVRAGIEPCVVAQTLSAGGSTCSPGDWVAFAEAFNNSLNFPYWAHYVDLAGASMGDGVKFSIYFDQPGNELHFTITPPSTSGPEQFYKTQAYGPIFDHAAALDDFLDTSFAPFPLPPGLPTITAHDAFMEGALTTYSGAKGSFVGPWTTREVQATSNGLPFPSGTVRVQPGPLSSDGIKANGAIRPSDAFDQDWVG